MKIAVIGAGMSGLSAASALSDAGAQVDVFEKSRGLGGRLAVKRLDWGNVDVGAQYFTARDHGFQQQVAKWSSNGHCTRWRFTPSVLKNGVLEASPDDIERYVGVPGMNSIVHALAAQLRVHRGTRITRLQRRNHAWLLESDTGEIFGGYDKLVVSLPADQSRVLLYDASEIADKIPTDIHQPCWALALATQGEVAKDIQGIFGDDIVSWVSRHSAKPGREYGSDNEDIWVLHFSPEWSCQHEQVEGIAQIGLQWLQNALVNATQTELRLKHSHQHFWRYARVANDGREQVGEIVDVSQGLAVVGDWCCGGRVEGAFLSAQGVVNAFEG